MRILMLAQFYPPIIGGEERHVVTLSEALVARGHEVAVATMPHPARGAFEVINGVEVYSLHGVLQRASGLFSDKERPHAACFPDLELTIRLSQLVDKFKPDIVHGHNWIIHSFLPLRALKPIGLVSTLHDYSLICSIKTLMRQGTHCDGPSLGGCLSCAGAHFGTTKGAVTSIAHFVSRPLYRRLVDHFIAVSNAVAIKSGIVDGSVPYRVLPTFIPDNAGSLSVEKDPRLDLLPPDGFLLFVGELNRHKGVKVLLDAYARLRDAPPLVLIGRRCPDTPQVLPDNVFLFESWPHASVMHAWNRCLFGLAPSIWVEPCGTVVMEANVMGKPIITTNHGGFSELVEHGYNGLHVPPDDAEALALAMQCLIDDPQLRDSLAAKALVQVERFKAKSIVPQIETIYRDVCMNRSFQRRKLPAVHIRTRLDA